MVELTIAMHRVFESPRDPIIFDTGHQSYVHKILTGRQDRFSTLRQRHGLSGYPSPDESEHDWVANSHASTALSYADGLAKAFRHQGRPGTVVAFVGDGSLTGGMAWEALNNIAASDDLPLVIIVNDNGRSYTPTVGGLANHLSALRTNPRYEQILDVVKRSVSRAPLVGSTAYDILHGIKIGLKDVLAPQGLFSDLGLKYVGPIDGHDIAAVERALQQARQFGGPVLVHCLTRKGNGFKAAEDHEEDRFHTVGKIDAMTGAAIGGATGQTMTDVFSEELLRLGSTDERVVAVTAAMLYPTGLHRFAKAFPDRCFDVGIAEQHAVTSAAGLAMGGLHPVVAVYATFLNRAFDQLLLDVALHRCGVTFVLDRAGVTGPDGPSHHGMWDMSIAPAGARPAPGRAAGRHPAPGGAGPCADHRRRAVGAAVRQGQGAAGPGGGRGGRRPGRAAADRAAAGAGGRLRPPGRHRGGGRRAAGRPGDRGHRGRPGVGAAGQPRTGSSRRRARAGGHHRGQRGGRRLRRPTGPGAAPAPRWVRRCASSASRRSFSSTAPGPSCWPRWD